LGTKLLECLIQVGRDESLSCITAYISPENYVMQNISKKLGFHLKLDSDGGVMEAKLDL
jgi:hypothetical protein